MRSNINVNQQRQQNNRPEKLPVEILIEGIKETDILKEWGHYLAEGSEKEKVKSTQLRKFFGAVKRIQADFDNNKNEIVLLLPKLAYAVGRNKGNRIKDLYELLEPLIKDIKEDKTKFKNFVNAFEAIVAYHKEKAD